MFKKVTPILIITALTACSTPIDRRQANGNDEYTQAETVALLKIQILSNFISSIVADKLCAY